MFFAFPGFFSYWILTPFTFFLRIGKRFPRKCIFLEGCHKNMHSNRLRVFVYFGCYGGCAPKMYHFTPENLAEQESHPPFVPAS
jgi:hypothetical protein